jgi:DNA-binding LacI/PurR family transcriptional regulator
VTQTRDRTERGRPTLDEVATMTGVSRATVSRVVNGSARVSPEVRLRVQVAIERLGYTPNRAARSLVTRRSDSVAVVIAQPAGQVFADPFFPRLLRGISSALTASDRQLILLMPESPADERRVADYVIAGHVDGALLVSLHDSDSLPARLTEYRLPLVVLGRPPRDSQVSYVDADNQQGAYAAVAHLVATGRRVIATITGPLDTAPGMDRLQGYRDALARGGVRSDPTLEAVGDFTQEGSAAAMERLLATHPEIDAVFAASDLMAASALSVITASGRRVPADVALVGFDDMAIALSTTPHLSSVRQPIEEMGHEMARLLVESLTTADSVPRRVILATQLIKRASSARRSPP